MVLLGLLFALQSAQAVDLDADPRLKKPIDVRADAEATPALCRRLSAAVGVPLAASPAIKNDLVILFTQHHPASEVMSRVAENFHWEWAPRGDGYELRPVAKFGEIERKQYRADVLSRWSLQMDQAKADLRRFGQSDFVAAQSAALKALADEAAKHPKGDEGEGVPSRSAETLDKLALADPMLKLRALAQASLTEQDLVDLDRGPLVFSTSPKPLQRPFGSAAKMFVTSLPGLIGRIQSQIHSMAAKMPAASREMAWGLPAASWNFDPVAIKVVRMSFTSEPGEMVLDLLDGSGRVLLQSVGGRFASTDAEFEGQSKEQNGGWTRSRYVGPPLDQTALSRNLTPTAAFVKAEKEAKELILEPPLLKMPLVFPKGERQEPLVRLGRFVNELASLGDVCLVSDCYDGYLRVAEEFPRGKTVREELDRWAIYAESDWRYEQGWVMLRSSHWAMLRAGHAPRDVVFEAGDTRMRQHGMTFEQQSAFASRLTIPQMDSPIWELAAWWGWTSDGNAVRRFWAAIDPAVRDSLRSGTTFTLGQLGAPATQRFVDWMRASDYRILGKNLSSVPNSVNGEPDFEGSHPPYYPPPDGAQPDREITELSNAELTSAMVEVRYAEIPCFVTVEEPDLGVLSGIWSPGMVAFSTIQPTGQLKAEAADYMHGTMRYGIQDVYRIRIHLPGRDPIVAFAKGEQAQGPVDFDVNKWPPDLRKRVEAHWKQRLH